MKFHILPQLAAALMAIDAGAEFLLDPVFSSGMVLQQRKPIAFFGTADPGEKIRVTFGALTREAVPDDRGAWQVEFPAMEAGSRSHEITFAGNTATRKLSDVLIGDVWFCSGQSNMEMPIGITYRRGMCLPDCKEVAAAARDPELRCALQRKAAAHGFLCPAAYSQGKGWLHCTPATAPHFSAVAYFFGKALREELKIPIGLVIAARGGTRIEPWISPDGVERAGLKKELQLLRQFDWPPRKQEEYEQETFARFRRDLEAWLPSFRQRTGDGEAKFTGWLEPGYDETGWENWNQKLCHTHLLVRRYRVKFDLPSAMRQKSPLLKVLKVGESAAVFLNGQRIGGWEPFEREEKKGLACRIPTGLLRERDNVLAIRTEQLFPAQNPANMSNLRQTRLVLGRQLLIPTGWKQKDEFALARREAGKSVPPSFPQLPYRNARSFPGLLYNGMVAPWTRLPIRGIVWYQGESNAGDPRYLLQHRALIADWRRRWKEPELPFLLVQLAGYAPAHVRDWQTLDPNRPSRLALTRDIQQRMMELPRVGVATAVDIGEADNIHPPEKREVGRRLALEALRMVYGRAVVSRGPLFRSASREGNSLRIRFDNAKGGLKTGDGKAPNGFAVAGRDGRFFSARAAIDGETVLVSAPEVPEPEFVRYAYADFRGNCNLQNQAGLPAYPFRSDPDRRIPALP